MSVKYYYALGKIHLKEKLKRYLSKKTIGRIKALHFYLKLILDVTLVTMKVYFTRPRGTVLLCYDSPAPFGGTELQINLIVEQLKKMGWAPLVVTTGTLSSHRSSDFFLRLKQAEIDHLHFGNLGLAKHLLFQKYRTVLLKKLHASFCHCFNPLSTLMVGSAKKAGLKILYSETGLPCKNFWWEPLLPNIDKIESAIAISTASLSQLRTELGYKGQATVIYSLIDPPPLHLRARSPVLGELQIVYFGQMHIHKGVILLFNAFRSLLTFFLNAYLTFTGEGVLEAFWNNK